MKYAFRRLLLGVVIVPVVAFAWVVFYALLVCAGAEPTSSVGEVWNAGLGLGIIATLIFAGEAVLR